MGRPQYFFAEDLAGHIADALWGTEIDLSDDQILECLRLADALVKLGYRTEDGAATPPASPTATPAATGGEQAAECATGATNTGAASSSTHGPGPDLIGGQPGPAPRVFCLDRHTDVSHVSGTGVVAWGVQFPDGAVAVRWHGAHPSTVAWPSVEDAIAIHGHSGATEIRWVDDAPIQLWPAEPEPSGGEPS